jgi:hypothetical protein
MDLTSGFTDAQAAAVTAVLNLAPPELRGGVSAAIEAALGPPSLVPFSDVAVLAAIGGALARYSGAVS